MPKLSYNRPMLVTAEEQKFRDALIPARPLARSEAFLTIEILKKERLTAAADRQDEIDIEIRRREPELTDAEAVYIVRRYESGLASTS